MTAADPPVAGQANLRRALARAGRLRLTLDERTLFVAGGAMVAAGFAAMIVGWAGTSRTVLVAGQIPYLASGGLIGLALVFAGGFLYFGYWLATLVKENRQRAGIDHDETIRLRLAVEELSRSLTAAVNARPASAPAMFVATGSGSMMHLPSCAAVAGREGLRYVSEVDGLKPCGICRPLDPPA